jgi:hypothetical protein
MKKVFSIIAFIVASFTATFAQDNLEVTPSSSTIVVNHGASGNVSLTLTIKYYADVTLPGPITFSANIQSIVTASSITAPATASGNSALGTIHTYTVMIPNYTPNGTVFTFSITATKADGSGSMTKTATITVGTALAVELLSVNAKATQGKNALTWATASEKDNNKFVVERSVNGVDFTAVGEVKAAGTSQTVSNYSFLDENVTGSVNYYRIQSVDMTGKMNASKVVAVASKGTLSANSVGSQLNIVSDVEGQAKVNVVNLSGQIVASQVVNLTSGASLHTLNFNQTGLFIVNVTNGKSTVSTKMVR